MITNFNTELEKLPISANVLTQAFMDDTDSTSLENMPREYSAGSGTGSAGGDINGRYHGAERPTPRPVRGGRVQPDPHGPA